jgi:Na+/H+-dicarboxylate symporter
MVIMFTVGYYGCWIPEGLEMVVIMVMVTMSLVCFVLFCTLCKLAKKNIYRDGLVYLSIRMFQPLDRFL